MHATALTVSRRERRWSLYDHIRARQPPRRCRPQTTSRWHRPSAFCLDAATSRNPRAVSPASSAQERQRGHAPSARARLADISAVMTGKNRMFIGWREAELRAKLDGSYDKQDDLRRERDELRAENERLRAALQEIIDHPAPSRVATVAREALARDTE